MAKPTKQPNTLFAFRCHDSTLQVIAALAESTGMDKSKVTNMLLKQATTSLLRKHPNLIPYEVSK